MNLLFTASWHRAWQGLQAQGTGDALRDAVLARYAEPHRRYHTLQHLGECLAWFERVRQAPDRPAEVEMALWFHDAIYDLGSPTNEARSADWAHAALRDAGVAAEPALRVRALILATQHSALPHGRDEQVLVDIDLSILGAPAPRFAEYEQQIREEYAHVPDLLFRLKRRDVLEGFLARPEIYATPVLHHELEAQARANLRTALAGLTV
jgi:predicted metal-dependent HD superfamily phosphohydrolase